MKKQFNYPIIFLVLFIGIFLGIQLEKVFSGDNLRQSIIKFNDVITYINKYYMESVDSQKLVEVAIDGMLKELDPHSVYIPPKKLEKIEEEYQGNFEGIGVEFQIINDTLTVITPILGGPSEALGILSGDKIVKIGSQDCVGISEDEVLDKLRGKKGTEVDITIYRSSINRTIDYTIVRDKIPIYSVDTHLMYDNETGYISVSKFSSSTSEEMIKALEDLRNRDMKKLVLDLRNNPGGYLNQAFQIADMFIDGEKLIVYTEGRRSEFNEKYYSSKSFFSEKYPLIILVNKGSASASEIVAGAVQDWDRGIIVGQTTFGKGLVQRQFELNDNSAIRVTISKYLTPSGRAIQRDYKNSDDYYSDLHILEKEGDNFTHTTENDTNRSKYKTNSGRIVYGGGGITPDFIVNPDTLTNYSISLLKNNIYTPFVLDYLKTNSKRISNKYSNLKDYLNGFSFTDVELENFVKFAEEKKVKFEQNDFNKDKELIRTRIKALIARNFWNNEGWFSTMLKVDKQFQKGIQQFSQAEQLAGINK